MTDHGDLPPEPDLSQDGPRFGAWADRSLSTDDRVAALVADLDEGELVAVVCNDFRPFERRGVPSPAYTDGPCGLRDAPGATALPVGISLAATFDPTLASEYAKVLAAETRHVGRNTLLGPSLDIARDPAGGRLPEGYGEEPELVARMGEEYVRGVQSRGVLVMVKHFICNNFESRRTGWGLAADRGDSVDVRVDRVTLHETYLRPFRRVADAGAWAFMGSYNRLNGRYVCHSADLLEIPRVRWGWQGFFAPDFIFAVRDPEAAWTAGLDLPALGGEWGRTAHIVRDSDVDPHDSVRRLAGAMIASGAADAPDAVAQGTPSTDAHRLVARRVATRGAVLLKNDHGALPLGSEVGSLAVIGPSGLDAIYVLGGSASVALDPDRLVTPLAGLRARAGNDLRVEVSQGSLGDAPLPDVPPEAFTTPDGAAPGVEIVVRCQDGAGVEREVRDVVPAVELDGPPAGVSGYWRATLRTRLTSTEGGEHRLSLLVSGHAEATLDGKRIMAGAREAFHFLGGPSYPLHAVVTLPAGKPMLLEVTYEVGPAIELAELGLHPGIRLGWQRPAGMREEAAAAAARCDAAVVMVNAASGEGMDRADLALPDDQDLLVEAVAAKNPRTVVVLNTPGPVLMPWLRSVAAVLEMWYPGEQFGAALADIVFGDVAPGGRLPITFPRSIEDLPGLHGAATSPAVVDYAEGSSVGYRHLASTGRRALFPFGHGLSYGAHLVRLISIELTGDSARLALEVSETSCRGSDATVQVYARPDGSGPEQRRLVAFRRVALEASATVALSVVVGPDAWCSYDAAVDDVIPHDGTYELTVADNAEDEGLAVVVVLENGALAPAPDPRHTD